MRRYVLFFIVLGCGGFACDRDLQIDGVDQSRRLLARNVILKAAASRYAGQIDTETRVLASNVIYENLGFKRQAAVQRHRLSSANGGEANEQGSNIQSDIEADNVEDALTETNANLEQLIVGTWNVTNIGQNKTGVVTFHEDGTYTIESGYFEAGGSFLPEFNIQSGTYAVFGDVIGFKYDGLEVDLPFNRFALIIYKRPNRIVHTVQGHSHGIEVLERAGKSD